MSCKVLINWGAYDIDNLGDLLFPIIIDYHFTNDEYKVVHTSPTSTKSQFKDAIETIKIKDVLKSENIKGLIVGGGNLISWTVSSAIPYRSYPILSEIVHPSFFIVPYILYSKYYIPYFFNSVGVSKPIPNENKILTKIAIENASYCSFRDKISVTRIMECNISSSDLKISLDSAFIIDSIYSKEQLKQEFKINLTTKYKIPKEKKIVVLYIKQRYFNNEYLELEEICKFFDNLGFHTIFISLSLCFGDEEILDKIDFNCTNLTIIKKPESIFEILSILASSEYYIGSSLHGGIVSAAYGNSPIFVADEKTSGILKISGFLEQLKLKSSLYNSWCELHNTLKNTGRLIFEKPDDKLICHHKKSINESFKVLSKIITNSNQSKANQSVETNDVLNKISEYYEI